MDWSYLVHNLVIPLSRMVAFMAGGLLFANVLESLHWTRFVAKLAQPLARTGRLNAICAAAFSLAFFSAAAANGLLSESYHSGKLSKKELIFANLFNSCPTFLVHLPTQFFLAYAFLGNQAFVYTGLTLSAAFLRTLGTLAIGRMLLPPLASDHAMLPARPGKSWRQTLALTLKRFKRRITKLILVTVPTYCLVFAAQEAGWFTTVEEFLVRHNSALSFLPPEGIGLVALHVAGDAGIALSAAASLAANNSLSYPQIILALLAGNIVSSPMRAVRHQFPSYAGYFTPGLAGILVCVSQVYRAISLVFVAFVYYKAVF